MDIKKVADSVRFVRGDGNCFYRALGFSFLELLICLGGQKALKIFEEKVEK